MRTQGDRGAGDFTAKRSRSAFALRAGTSHRGCVMLIDAPKERIAHVPAALCESWMIPFLVLLSAAMAVLGAVVGLLIAQLALDRCVRIAPVVFIAGREQRRPDRRIRQARARVRPRERPGRGIRRGVAFPGDDDDIDRSYSWTGTVGPGRRSRNGRPARCLYGSLCRHDGGEHTRNFPDPQALRHVSIDARESGGSVRPNLAAISQQWRLPRPLSRSWSSDAV